MAKEQMITEEEVTNIVKRFVAYTTEHGKENEMTLFRKWINELRKHSDTVQFEGQEMKIPSYSTVINRFGSWKNALDTVGAVQPTFAVTKRVLDEGKRELSEIREHFLRCINYGEGTFTPRKYQRYATDHNDAPRFRQILFQYDNWDSLLNQLHEKFPNDGWNEHQLSEVNTIPQKSKGKNPEGWNRWDDSQQREYMKQQLWNISQDNHGDLSPKIYIRSEAYPNVSTVIRRFKSWENAVRETLLWHRDRQQEQMKKDWFMKQAVSNALSHMDNLEQSILQREYTSAN